MPFDMPTEFKIFVLAATFGLVALAFAGVAP